MIKLLRAFAPPKGVRPNEVRAVGARNALLGLVLASFGVLVVLSLDRLSHGALLDPTVPKPGRLRLLSGLPVLLGFLAMVVGLYRALTGIHPAEDGTGTAARVGRLGLLALIAASLLAVITGSIVRLWR